jgi:two-component system, sensor histidine kinase and response regulator
MGLEMSPAVYGDAPSALEAFEAANQTSAPFSIVVLDRPNGCPGKFELLDQIMLRNEVSRIVVTSSRCDACHPKECRSAGVDAFVSKPIDESYLERVLRNLVEDIEMERPTCDQLQAGTALKPEQVGRPLRVLLVEDNRVNQKVAVTLLTKRGHHVTVASNGLDGLDAVSNGTFDAVLMDVQMPVMNGWQATAAIREREKALGSHLPIIAMTAHAMKEDIDRCEAAGMDGYVSKPFRIEELLKELDRVQSMRTTPRDLIRMSAAKRLGSY